MPPHKNDADNILMGYVQNVRRVCEKTAELARMQREQTMFLVDMASRIGRARQSMLLSNALTERPRSGGFPNTGSAPPRE